MSITLTSSSTSLIYSTPISVGRTVGKTIGLYNFSNGSEKILDKGKTSDKLTLTGVESGDAFDLLKWTNNVMDNSEVVTLSGMSDTNLNTEYLIDDISFDGPIGTVQRYKYTMTLVRRFD